MKKWTRHLYQPGLPLGADGKRVTGSKEHIALSRKAAAEGMVLLKNEGAALPVAAGKKVVLFGKGTIDYVKGGGGSGDVTVAYTRNFYEGMKLKEAEGKVQLFHELAAYYEKYVKEQYEAAHEPGMLKEPEVPEDIFGRAKAFSDTAIITICRFSGEGWDRSIAREEDNTGLTEWELEKAHAQKEIFPDGDFRMTPLERALIEKVKKEFKHVIIVLNVGGMVETAWLKEDDAIDAAILAWQGGMEGGLAAADLLCGDETPSGKLPDTFARELEDYPSSYNFHESKDYVEYTEDIYVGYRYFETIPGADKKVVYPFGYGLSYTEFAWENESVYVTGDSVLEQEVHVMADVVNVGAYAGKEVVQVYYGAPQGALGKPAKELITFAKTRKLLPGECQRMHLSFKVKDMASYDDTGKVQKSAWLLEAGSYQVYAGTSVREIKCSKEIFCLENTVITEQLSEKLKPFALKERMKSDGSMEAVETFAKEENECIFRRLTYDETEGVVPETRRIDRYYLYGTNAPKGKKLEAVVTGEITLDEFMAQLTVEDKICLLGGQPNVGLANTFGIGNQPIFGIPNVQTADGPAGLRIAPECGVCTTAWPCATMMAATFNTELALEVGAAAAMEVKENNFGVWLAPALNIHRSPLCGRNFEYYSEDCVLSGKIGTAMVRGIQSKQIAATVKHFAFNNKETNRKQSDSRVSERAAREIYLKGFEMIVKEADPWCLMSSYNKVNGSFTSECKDLLTGILREEWGYKGIVTTDWWTSAEQYLEVKAGNDLKMANGYPDRMMEAYEKGVITEEEISVCAKRILELILKME